LIVFCYINHFSKIAYTTTPEGIVSVSICGFIKSRYRGRTEKKETLGASLQALPKRHWRNTNTHYIYITTNILQSIKAANKLRLVKPLFTELIKTTNELLYGRRI